MESSISVVDVERDNIARVMSMLPDDTYDAFVIDATEDDSQNILRLELTITSGEHKGEVVSLRAANVARDAIDLIGLPVQLHVHDGIPSVTFD